LLPLVLKPNGAAKSLQNLHGPLLPTGALRRDSDPQAQTGQNNEQRVQAKSEPMTVRHCKSLDLVIHPITTDLRMNTGGTQL
jgi:hypothetical protein